MRVLKFRTQEKEEEGKKCNAYRTAAFHTVVDQTDPILQLPNSFAGQRSDVKRLRTYSW